MIEVGPFWIISLVTYVMTFALFFGLVFINNKVSKKYNILQYFPEEILANKNRFNPALKLLLYAFVIVSALPLFLIGFNFQKFGSIAYIEVIIASVILLSSLLNIILVSIPAKNIKPHSVIFTVHLTTSLLISGLVGFNGAGFFYFYQSPIMGSVPHLILGIVSTILAIVVVFMMFNPKLNKWYLLETKMEEDGSLIVSRPKIFPLAFSEWLSIIIAFFAGLLFILELIRY